MGERFSSGLGGRRKRPGILFQSRWPSISRTTGPCGGGRLDGGEPAGGVFPGEVLRPPGGSRRLPPPVRPPPDHPRAPAVAPRPSVRPPTGSAASTRGTLGICSFLCKTARLGRAPPGLRPRSVGGVPAVFGGMGPHLSSGSRHIRPWPKRRPTPSANTHIRRPPGVLRGDVYPLMGRDCL